MTTYLIASLVLVLFLVLPGGFLIKRRQQRSRADHEAKAMLAGCQHLLALLKCLQQHRGMSSAWLAGDKSFAERLRERREAIAAIFPALQPLLVLEEDKPRPCLTANELSLFRFKWYGLLDTLPSLSVEESFSIHSQMIGQVLDWLSAIGEARVELPAHGRVPHGLVRNFSHRLPTLTESLGQMRGIGSSVAARYHCTPVARVRLLFLLSRSEGLLAQAQNAGHLPGQAAAVAAVAALTATIRQEMLNVSVVKLPADVFFQTATQTIDTVYAWIEESGQALALQLLSSPASGNTGPILANGAFL